MDENKDILLEDDDFWKSMGSENVKSKESKESKESNVNSIITSELENPSQLEKSEEETLIKKKFTLNDMPSLVSTPSINKDSIPKEYQRAVDKALFIYSCLPTLDYDAIYKELPSLHVVSNPTPSLQSINQELEKVQSAKFRLEEIHNTVLRSYNSKKRILDILKDSWSQFSTQKGADNRKAESTLLISDFEFDFALTETLYKTCEQALKNLDGLHDSLSRRITVIQCILKFHDIGRGALPDFDFNKFYSKLDANVEKEENSKSLDPTKGIDAEERNF